MANYAYNLYCKDAKFIDLQKIELPICDGDKCYEKPIVDELKSDIENARSILIASPIYNYDLNAVAKNLIELTGQSWTDRLIGFISAAGGKGSYMSPMSFANSLMLDGADWRGPVKISIKPENIPPIESPIEAVP